MHGFVYRLLTRLQLVLAGTAVSSEDSTEGGSVSKLVHVLAGRIQLLTDRGTQGCSGYWSEAPSVPCHMDLSNISQHGIWLSSQQIRESQQDRNQSLFIT